MSHTSKVMVVSSFYRTFIIWLSDSSGDKDIFQSTVKVAEVAQMERERYVCMLPSTQILILKYV